MISAQFFKGVGTDGRGLVMVDWRYLLKVFWARKYVVILIAFLAVLATTLVTARLPLLYEASSTILVGNLISNDAARTDSTLVLRSLEDIIQSDDVLRAVVDEIGPATLYPRFAENSNSSISLRIRSILSPLTGTVDEAPVLTPTDRALLEVRKRLSVGTQIDSALLQVSFRHPDPSMCLQFVDRLTNVFLSRRQELFVRPGRLDVMRSQLTKLTEELRSASQSLSSFTQESGVSDVAEQQRLLLQRESELSSSIASSRALLSENQAQLTSLNTHLAALKQETAGEQQTPSSPQTAGPSAGPRSEFSASDLTGNPLLVTRLQEDGVQRMFLTTEAINGLNARLAQQNRELAGLRIALGHLSARKPEFQLLTTKVAQAQQAYSDYAKTMTEEQALADLATSRYSDIQIAERAQLAPKPVSPSFSLTLPLGVVVGLILGVICALGMELLPKRGRELLPSAAAE
jgi:uncharacterized protein involved in exopolysaccharide biosynthesis